MRPVLGCIADDITGGTDLALTLAAAGFRVVQVFGQPDGPPLRDTDAVVVSLKIRTEPIDEAVSAALDAAKAMLGWGVEQLYFKYCSTFDSTREGNIGPIASALAELTQARVAPFVPSYPENGRTVFQSHLFVHDLLISNSSMRSHPLTPMVEADLRIWLQAQAPRHSVEAVHCATIAEGSQAVAGRFDELKAEACTFVIVDAISDAELRTIGAACRGLPLVTGGSGLARGLAENFSRNIGSGEVNALTPPTRSKEPVAVFSGSCSAMSAQQIEQAAKAMPMLRLNPCARDAMEEQVEGLTAQAQKLLSSGSVLIASTADPAEVEVAKQQLGAQEAGENLETMFGMIAERLKKAGVRNFVIGGGETSGAVAGALGLKTLRVGEEIAPGVPWMFDAEDSGIQIAFKSGNFGAPSFFVDAVNQLREEGQAL